MRQPAYDDGPLFGRLFRWPRWSWTLGLVLVNVAAFLVECAFSSRPMDLRPAETDPAFFSNYLALSLNGLYHGYVWQLITYQFLHATFWHILFNCWAIYVFGRVIEDLLGARNFILIMLSSGVVGGLFQVLSSLFWPQLFGDEMVPTIGASAGAFGLVAAFAALFPERVLTLLLFLVIPIRMRAKTLLILSAVLALGGILFPDLFNFISGGHIANAAHLGGMLTGLLYVLVVIQGRGLGGLGFVHPAPPSAPAAPAGTAPARVWRSRPGKPKGELSAEDLLKTQVDPILDKISAHGLNSLSAREREILEKASAKMAKR
jgi:membrane associated rhomboid family serine protease